MATVTSPVKKLWYVLMILGLVGFLAPDYAAADPNEAANLFDLGLEELMNIEVETAGRKAQAIRHAPADITVITEKEIRDSGARTIAQLLERLPGIYIPTQGHGEPSIYIRGVGERYNNKTLLLVDGYPSRNLCYYSFHLDATIPLANIKQIEVIRGPGSSLYGTNAFAGVINIITKDPQDIEGTELRTTIGSRGTREHHLLWGTHDDDGGVSFLARYLDWDSDRIDRDEVGDLSGKTRFFENSAFHLKGNRGNIDYQASYYRTTLPDFMEGTSTIDEDVQQHASFRLGHTHEFSDRLSMRTRTYANLHWSDGKTYDFDGGALDKLKRSSRQSDIIGADVQWRYQVSQINDLVFGVMHEREHLHHSWSKEWEAPGFTQATSGWVSSDAQPYPTEIRNYNTGIYAEDEIKIIPDRLSVTLGARWDEYKATGPRISPRGAVVWTLSERTAVKLLYGEAFRSPSYRELYKQSDDGENEGNTSLAAETMKTTELNISHRLTKNHQIDIALFQSRFKNFIKTVGDGSYANLQPRKYKGLEIGLRGRCDTYDFHYFANYTLLNAKEASGRSIGGLPREMVNAGLTYEGLRCVTISPYSGTLARGAGLQITRMMWTQKTRRINWEVTACST